jgi:hypothetical protein
MLPANMPIRIKGAGEKGGLSPRLAIKKLLVVAAGETRQSTDKAPGPLVRWRPGIRARREERCLPQD